jgi:predicted RND superfamily exporter protein
MIISLGLASDATIHFAYKYWRARYFGRSKKHSLEIVFFYGAVPVIIGSLVLAVTFYGLSFSNALTLQLIGQYSAILILMSLAVDLFILPILLLVSDKYFQQSNGNIKE